MSKFEHIYLLGGNMTDAGKYVCSFSINLVREATPLPCHRARLNKFSLSLIMIKLEHIEKRYWDTEIVVNCKEVNLNTNERRNLWHVNAARQKGNADIFTKNLECKFWSRYLLKAWTRLTLCCRGVSSFLRTFNASNALPSSRSSKYFCSNIKNFIS